jgi:3-oxoacyl-[acyl-carrier protein] reductase
MWIVYILRWQIRLLFELWKSHNRLAKLRQGAGALENITVNNVCPGRILTDRLRQIYHIDERVRQGESEETIVNEMAQGIPMGRVGTPEELGAFVAFLASRQAAYITGTTTQIDGGLVRSLL